MSVGIDGDARAFPFSDEQELHIQVLSIRIGIYLRSVSEAFSASQASNSANEALSIESAWGMGFFLLRAL